MRRIPGTEQASIVAAGGGLNDGISVSPDEKWLVFWETSSPSGRQLASIDLTSFQKTTHNVSELPAGVVAGGFASDWDEIGLMFDAACWHGGLCYVELLPLSTVVAVDPAQDAVLSAALPPGLLTCSDCPPTDVFVKAAYERTGLAPSDKKMCSIAWHGGKLGRYVYEVGRDATIVRVGPDRARETIVQMKSGLHHKAIEEIRISPSEQYLAYTIHSRIEVGIPHPGGQFDVYVRHSESGREKRIATHSEVSNLIWSSDSMRLYFAGNGENGDDSAVYCVDVAETFST
jgi:hypothetical protein